MVHFVHHARSFVVPGPNVRSHRRTTSARASAAGIIASSPVQSPIGAQRYWLEIHEPSGRPRASLPSVDIMNSRRVDTPMVPA